MAFGLRPKAWQNGKAILREEGLMTILSGAASMRRPELSRVDVATQTPIIPKLMPYCHASIRTLSEFFH
jgi:hypothetical protein